MVAERAENRRRPPLEELSPGLRDAVTCILNDPLPEDLTPRALGKVRRQVARYPRKARCRIRSWAGPAIAAAIVVMALAAYNRAAQIIDGQSAKSAALPATGADVAAAFDDDLPTVWAYSKAARRSPEALDALLDRQARQSFSANSRFFASTNVSPLALFHAVTLL